MPTGHRLTQDQIQYICERFADTNNITLAKEMGLSRSAINRVQARYHLSKSPEHINECAIRAGKASVVSRGNKPLGITPEVLARRGASYKKAFLAEQVRYKYGLEPKTKIRIKKEPRAKREQRQRLIKKGYIIDEKNLVAYYTPGTNRSVRLESVPRGVRKGQVKPYYDFRPYAGELD